MLKQTHTLAADTPCPCGLKATFERCCGPRLNGQHPAETAEQLMRSRYTAHVLCDVDYLIKSWKAPNPQAIDPAAIERWCQESDWHGLTIHQTSKGSAADTEGRVEFSAFYFTKGAGLNLQELREDSYFIRQDGHWLYVDGDPKETEKAAKLGRNTPCPCGSGKKFKRCCGV